MVTIAETYDVETRWPSGGVTSFGPYIDRVEAFSEWYKLRKANPEHKHTIHVVKVTTVTVKEDIA